MLTTKPTNWISIYPKELASYIQYNNKYIPRMISQNESLIQYHRYWIRELKEVFKLTGLANYFHVDYYFFEGKNTNQLYTHPVPSNEFYELTINTDNIQSQNIINSKKMYKGYQIKYWFFKNWCKAYQDYDKYLILDKSNTIQDNKDYYVEGVWIKDKYMNCKIVTSTGE